MPSPTFSSFALSAFIAIACLPLDALAHWVQHCRAPTGDMTYTASNCPEGHALVAQQRPARPVQARGARTAAKKSPRPVTRAVDRTHESGADSTRQIDRSAAGKPAAKEKKEKIQRKKRPPRYLPAEPLPP